jgi:NAD(P) transhydrogenase subunit alpha
MIIGALKDNPNEETRIPLTPASAKRLTNKQGLQVLVESGMGDCLKISDDAFVRSGAKLSSRQDILKNADIILRIRKPLPQDISLMKPGALHISFLDPVRETGIIAAFNAARVSAISLEMIPRTTIAQKMDALSSQASLAGYTAVILAAERIRKVLPMMTTPAGTIPPARVFVVGAGVAGLQAIATAKRLGARVDAFDTRPAVKEQVLSLGGKFVEIDLGETGQTKDGYAKSLTPEQLALQREGMMRTCAQSDILITTAQVFGRKAPVIITRDMVNAMKPGSVIVDLAVESGGNVEGVELGKEIEINGVRVIGLSNLPGKASVDASEMLGANFINLIEHYWDKKDNAWKLKLDDDITKGCLITHDGRTINEKISKNP